MNLRLTHCLLFESPRGRFLSWMDFLQGIARVRKDATARKIMGLNRPNQWSLISLLVDVKFPPEEEKALMDKLSYFESHGIKHLQTKQSKELSKEGVHANAFYFCVLKTGPVDLTETSTDSSRNT